ncbi:MAG: hypothetical protein N2C14_17565, partial [Planctomycetales bacterium]
QHAVAELLGLAQRGKLDRKSAQIAVGEVRKESQRGILNVLTPDQKAELAKIQGPPFDLTQLRFANLASRSREGASN